MNYDDIFYIMWSNLIERKCCGEFIGSKRERYDRVWNAKKRCKIFVEFVIKKLEYVWKVGKLWNILYLIV